MYILEAPYQQKISELLTLNGVSKRLLDRWSELHNLFDEPYLKRILGWLEFFDETFDHYKHHHFHLECGLLKEASVAALFDLALNEAWFSQTTHEFELSQSFYNAVLDSGYLVRFNGKSEALYFLKLSIVYSYYPGYVHKSIGFLSRLLLHDISITRQSVLFKELFARYDNACSMAHYENLNYMTLNDLHLFMRIINGGSLHQLTKNNFRFSKQQSYLFLHQLPSGLDYPNDVFKTGWYYASLLVVSNDVFFFKNFISVLRARGYLSRLFGEDFEFWKRVYRYLCAKQAELDRNNMALRNGFISLRDIIDYIHYQKYVDSNEVSLKGKSFENLLLDIRVWEEEITYKRKKPTKKIHWGAPELPEQWRKTFYNTEYLIEEIKNSDELFDESRIMRHCVLTYLDQCIYDGTRIFSMKMETQEGVKKILTIEVQSKKVTQVRGIKNRLPKKEEMAVIEAWAIDKKFEIILTN